LSGDDGGHPQQLVNYPTCVSKSWVQGCAVSDFLDTCTSSKMSILSICFCLLFVFQDYTVITWSYLKNLSEQMFEIFSLTL
jgi:hypothetical protein